MLTPPSDSGVFVDADLINELKSPGSDQRIGVNIFTRPPAGVIDQVAALQARLKTLDPYQYYYPAADLHLTFFEISSGLSPSQAERVFDAVKRVTPPILASIPKIRLESPVARFDDRAGAVAFQNKAGLDDARHALIEALTKNGVPLAQRSPARATGSAHVTFVRYLRPLAVARERFFAEGSRVPLGGSWTVNERWLGIGANWYGMTSRIQAFGPL